MNKKHILFDLDGTITDPKVGITKSVQFSLKSFGIDVPDADSLVSFIGPPLRESYERFYGFNSSEAETAVTKYREYFSEIGIYENTLYDGMDKLLKSLTEQDKTLIVATSKPTVFAVRVLEHFNLDRYFCFVAGSELNGERSKKSEVISYALQSCNISSVNSTIMIGDRKHDILGAAELGMEGIGVMYGYGSRKELTDAGATFIVENAGELLELLTK